MLYYSDKFVLDVSYDLEKSIEGCKKINDNRDIITIIGFYEIVVKRLVMENHISMISPSVIFEDDSIVDIGSNNIPKDRPYKENMKRKGLPGLSGSSGYNFTVICLKCNSESINFISKGTKGGRGQNGEPPGKDGEDGNEGLLLLHTRDNHSSIHPDISSYKQIAYIGINGKKNSSELMSLFHL